MSYFMNPIVLFAVFNNLAYFEVIFIAVQFHSIVYGQSQLHLLKDYSFSIDWCFLVQFNNRRGLFLNSRLIQRSVLALVLQSFLLLCSFTLETGKCWPSNFVLLQDCFGYSGPFAPTCILELESIYEDSSEILIKIVFTRPI